MKATIRAKIDSALANKNKPNLMPVAQTVADNIINGERLYTLKEAADVCRMDPSTARRKFKGKPGFLQFAQGGDIQITESLLKSIIAEAAARGMQLRD